MPFVGVLPEFRADSADSRAWRSVALLLLAVGWGANHDAAAPALLFAMYALGLVPARSRSRA